MRGGVSRGFLETGGLTDPSPAGRGKAASKERGTPVTEPAQAARRHGRGRHRRPRDRALRALARGPATGAHLLATFTADLLAAVAWLLQCGVRSVAMESTALYWLPFAQLLAEAGIEVVLVNARHVRHVPGRKSDVPDCHPLPG